MVHLKYEASNREWIGIRDALNTYCILGEGTLKRVCDKETLIV